MSAVHSIYDADYSIALAPAWVGGREMMKAIRNLVLSTTAKSPGPLFACRISRAEALKKYTRCFQIKGALKTRFDPIQDTVLFAYPGSFTLPPLPFVFGLNGLFPDYRSQFSGVENISIGLYTIGFGDLGDLQALFSQFPTLKKLTLVINSERIASCLKNDDDLLLQTLDPELVTRPEHLQTILSIAAEIKISWKEKLAENSNDSEREHLMDVEFPVQVLKYSPQEIVNL